MKVISDFLSFTIPEPNTGCLLWIGGATDNRYGTYWDGEKQHRAHVYAYEKANGKLPKGKIVCHKCDVTFCVEEAHLYAGTSQSNADDKVLRNRQSRMFANNNPQTKLTTEAIELIYKLNMPHQKIADLFGVSQSQISRIKRGIRSGRTGR